jgi:signal transduction histidine kinase
MQIRSKLSLYFTLTSSLLMLIIMGFIYLLFSNFTKNDFYKALHERTEVTAQLYLEADEISPASLNKIKERFVNTLPAEVIRVYDSTDELTFVKENNQNWSKQVINEVRQKKYLAYEENGKQIVGISYDDNQGTFVILASAIDIYGQQRKKNLLQIMGVLFAVQLLVQFLVGRRFAENALHPIQKVNEQVQKISATDLHLRVQTENEKDELGILAANFNGLLERIEKSFDLQKMFVANVSHELKTPITNIVGEIEVAMSKERTPAEYNKTFQSVLVEADRLHDIVINFLMLATAENDVARQQTEPVRLDELLWEVQEMYAEGLVQVQMAGLPEDENRLYIKTNKTLLLLALTNIIQNGLKFSSGQPVVCSLQFSDAAINISIADKGIGIEPGSLPNIFEPFYRSGNAAAYQGHGIGLYIAKKVIDLLGGNISARSEAGKGSVFNINFTQKA